MYLLQLRTPVYSVSRIQRHMRIVLRYRLALAIYVAGCRLDVEVEHTQRQLRTSGCGVIMSLCGYIPPRVMAGGVNNKHWQHLRQDDSGSWYHTCCPYRTVQKEKIKRRWKTKQLASNVWWFRLLYGFCPVSASKQPILNTERTHVTNLTSGKNEDDGNARTSSGVGVESHSVMLLASLALALAGR